MSQSIWSSFFGEEETPLAQKIKDLDDDLSAEEPVEIIEEEHDFLESTSVASSPTSQSSRNRARINAGKSTNKRLQDNLSILHQNHHPLRGRTVHLSRSLPQFNGLLRNIFDGLPTLAGQKFVIDDWFDCIFGRTIWHGGEEVEINYHDPEEDDLDLRRRRVGQNPCLGLGEYSISAMAFKVRLAELGPKKGAVTRWLTNEVVCGHIGNQPVIVLDYEIDRK